MYKVKVRCREQYNYLTLPNYILVVEVLSNQSARSTPVPTETFFLFYRWWTHATCDHLVWWCFCFTITKCSRWYDNLFIWKENCEKKRCNICIFACIFISQSSHSQQSWWDSHLELWSFSVSSTYFLTQKMITWHIMKHFQVAIQVQEKD